MSKRTSGEICNTLIATISMQSFSTMRGLLLGVLFTIFVSVGSAELPFKVKFEWKSIDYKWPTPEARKMAIRGKSYIKENVIIHGIRVWEDRMFLATPRVKKGVPATISTVPKDSSEKAPKLEPFPNWQRQMLGNCMSFISVEGLEIDTKGRIWILDAGRTQTNFNETVPSPCPPKLVIIDLKKIDFDGPNPGNAAVVRTYAFPPDVAAPTTNHLADLVLDESDSWYAYITDMSKEAPGIIVYSFKENKSWKVKNEKSVKEEAKTKVIDGEKLDLTTGSFSGVALSPVDEKRTLYFSHLGNYDLYAVNTKHLKDPEKNIAPHIKDLVAKKGFSEGMVVDNKFNLYFGLLTKNGVGRWNTKKSPLKENQEVVAHNDKTMEWPAKLTVHNGHLYLLSNKMQNFFLDMDFNKINFRIFSAKINAKSYLHPPAK